ncbi:MAG: alpha/beta hydrolase [Burkholderiaceae bacterium]|nr:alpha/beta hydrolase [Burkholderiaceae bacterium]
MRFEVDGIPAYAYTGGRAFDPSLPTVVFVHGAQHDHSVWILQSRYLAHHGRSVLALDLPGHGRSGGEPIATVEAMADWVLSALAAAGASRATIVGHSMGSLIAVECARRAPQAVAGVALVGTAFPMKVSDALLQAAADDEAIAFDMINYWSHSGITHHPGTPGPGFSIFWENRRLMERQRPRTLLNDFRACDAYSGGLDAARASQCPALFILGQADAMTPVRAANGLIDACREAAEHHRETPPEVVVIPGAGHALMAERPDEVLEALERFV